MAPKCMWCRPTPTGQTKLTLFQHRLSQQVMKVTLKAERSEDELIICHYDGTPSLTDSIPHAWIKLTRRLGLGGIRLHDTRRTHATKILKGNVSPKVVSERLRHSTVSLTLDVYSHVIQGLQKAAADQFDEILGRTTAPVPTVN